MPRPAKRETAVIHTLSGTLRLLVLEHGGVWLQRNFREPFLLSDVEARKLRGVLAAGEAIEADHAD